MKKLVLTGAATMALALGAFAQGSIVVDNFFTDAGYVSKGTAATHYNGGYTLQVWELNQATVPAAYAGVTGAVGANGVAAYEGLAAAGFTLEKTYTGTMADGIFQLGELRMASVSPAGSTVTLALAVWDSSTATWAGARAGGAVPYGGLSIFANATANYSASPVPPPLSIDGFNAYQTALVMTPIPEPSTFALAGLGAAALLIFRRRK